MIYLIQNNKNEMVVHDAGERVLSKLTPERPRRQHCVISRSSAFAINLPAFFLVGVIFLDFPVDGTKSAQMVNSYFPTDAEDRFLAALKSGALHPEHLTDFDQCDDA